MNPIVEIYIKYQDGERLTDEDISILLTAICAALPFLEAAPEFGLMRQRAFADRHTLEGVSEGARGWQKS